MKQILKALFIGSLLLATPAQSAFVDQYVGNYEASEWPDGFKIYVGRESKALFTQTGDPTAYTFVAHARADSSSTTALIAGTVTTSADNGGSITIAFSDDQTTNLLNSGRRVYVTLDVLIGGEYFPVAAGYVPAEPIGSQLPLEVTEVVFEDLLAQLEAQVALAEAAATAAETAQAAAEAAAANASGISDGNKGDITVASSGSAWTVNSGAVDYSEVANTPTIPTNNNELTNGAGYITGYTVTEGDVTTHESALTLTKSQISDLNEADYATAAQGALADSALQSGDNISVLTNDSGFITGYTVTEGDVTGVLSGATLTDAGTPASDDKILIQDTSDTNSLKYVSFDEFGGGGGVDWTTTQTTSTANGASNTAFKFVADNDFNLGKLFSFGDNSGDEKLYYKNGLIYISEPSYSTTYFGLLNAHQFGLHFSYNSANFVWHGNVTNTDDDFVSFSYRGLKFPTGYDASIGYNPVADADQATSTLTIAGQSAFPSATTNQDGGDLILKGGDNATGGGSDGLIIMQNLPTSDPGVTGALWNDSGTIKISP